MRLVDVFDKEVECDYRDEHYSVRDNGAVKRHSKEGKKPRPLDDVWTFGSFDNQKGYTRIRSEAVHRIVATAFLGPAPTPFHVVDHIDTNRQNNRPENLRWVTRLENIVLNPITRKRIEQLCGCSIENVLNDMSILHSKQLPPDIAWMHAVSKEEAAQTLNRFNIWVKEGKVAEQKDKKGLNYSAYVRDLYKIDIPIFLLEPEDETPSLDLYDKNLKRNRVFWRLEYLSGYVKAHTVIDHYYDKKYGVIYVACKAVDDVYPFYLRTIMVKKNEHLNKDTYSYGYKGFVSIAGLDKYMTLARGEEWTGEEVEDDYSEIDKSFIEDTTSESKESTNSSVPIEANKYQHRSPHYLREPVGADLSLKAYAEKLEEGTLFYLKINESINREEYVVERFLDKDSNRLFVVTTTIHGKRRNLTIITLDNYGFNYYQKRFATEEQLDGYINFVKREWC